MLKNQIGVNVSTRNLSMQNIRSGRSVRAAFGLSALTLAIISGCAVGPDVNEGVPPTSPVPAELPPPPVPDVIPGLQQGAEDAAIGTVTAVEGQGDLQSGPILGGVPITRGSINDPQHPLAQRTCLLYTSPSPRDS